MVILGVFLGSADGSYTDDIALVTKTILFASMAVNLLAIVLNLGSRAAIVALFVSLAGLVLSDQSSITSDSGREASQIRMPREAVTLFRLLHGAHSVGFLLKTEGLFCLSRSGLSVRGCAIAESSAADRS